MDLDIIHIRNSLFLMWSRPNPTHPEAVWRFQVQFFLQVFRRASAQPVEDVVVPLVAALHANPRLLQQVMGDEAANNGVLRSTQEGGGNDAALFYLASSLILVNLQK